MTKRLPSFPSDKPIVGIGNACVDIMSRVEDSFLDRHQIQKGQCIQIELAKKQELESLLADRLYQPGGDVANTLSCFTLLGGDAIFIGRIADDALGQMLMDDWTLRNIGFYNTPVASNGSESETTTGVFCLTTEDNERSFANYPGVGAAFSKDDIDTTILDKSDFLHLSGYMLAAPKTIDAYLYAADYMHAQGGTVAFSPSDISIMNAFAPQVEQVLEIADGIFLNEPEALHLTGVDSLPEAFALLRKRYSFGFVTMGKIGVWAFNGDEQVSVTAVTPPGEVIDTNGAGDNFTGGFLYGMRNGWSLEESVIMGSSCAAKVVTLFGARLPHDTIIQKIVRKAS